jgi:hypothetical protein
MNKFMSMVLAVILLVGMLSGCSLSGNSNLATQPTTTVPTTSPTRPQTTTTAPTQPTTVPTQPEDPGVELEAQADLSKEPYPLPQNEEWPKIINSVEELEELANSDFGQSLNTQAFERYDDLFFEEHTLILVYLFTHPVLKNYHVSSCLKMTDGSYSVVLYGEVELIGDAGHLPRYIVTFIAIKDHVSKDAVIQFTILDEETKLITN